MVHLWHSKAREEAEPGKATPVGMGVFGDIAVIISGKRLDNELVRLACFMAKRARHKVHLVHIIEVPRTLPLKAVLGKESENADKFLTNALKIAEETGCEAIAEVVQARDAGPAIVDEAKDHGCALIMLGLERKPQQAHGEFGKTLLYVLSNAPCRVWIVQDPGRTTAASPQTQTG